MLVLTRKPGESIVIGDSIRIEVLSQSRSGAVRLGIHAPEGIWIFREELIGDDGEGDDERKAC